MTATAEIIEQALQLPFEDQSRIIETLSENIDSESGFSPEYRKELDRRSESIRNGTATMIPHSEVQERMRKLLNDVQSNRTS